MIVVRRDGGFAAVDERKRQGRRGRDDGVDRERRARMRLSIEKRRWC